MKMKILRILFLIFLPFYGFGQLLQPTTQRANNWPWGVKVLSSPDSMLLAVTKVNTPGPATTTFDIPFWNGTIWVPQPLVTTSGISGTDFEVSGTGATRTFNLPPASATATGKLTAADWITFNAKQSAISAQNVTAASTKITLAGTPTGAALQAFSIDVNEANLTLNNIGGTLGVAKGGTNLTSVTAGDMLYALAPNVLAKLPIGATNQVLIVSGGIPGWGTSPQSLGFGSAQLTGDGSDGDVTITTTGNTITGLLSAGVLIRDAYFHNLTFNSGGQIRCGGYKIYVSGTLNMANASPGAIDASGSTGVSGASNGNGGAGGFNYANGTGGTIGAGGFNSATGGLSTTTNGGNGTNASTTFFQAGGKAGAGGLGGTGAGINPGGSGGTAPSPTVHLYPRRLTEDFMRGAAYMCGGSGGAGGGAGGGDDINTGSGGGGGGGSAGVIVVFADTINRGGGTVACLTARGAAGGTPVNVVGSNPGGGGGGGGSGGGFIYLVYNILTGSTTTGFASVTGGAGGNGGNAIGTGTGGTGGNGAESGVIVFVNNRTGQIIFAPNVLAGAVGSGPTGTIGGVGSGGGFNQLSL